MARRTSWVLAVRGRLVQSKHPSLGFVALQPTNPSPFSTESSRYLSRFSKKSDIYVESHDPIGHGTRFGLGSKQFGPNLVRNHDPEPEPL